jgi:hypothetical protein
MNSNQYYKYIVSFNKPVEVIDEYIQLDTVLAKNEESVYRILKKEYYLEPNEINILSKELLELFNFNKDKRDVSYLKLSNVGLSGGDNGRN